MHSNQELCLLVIVMYIFTVPPLHTSTTESDSCDVYKLSGETFARGGRREQFNAPRGNISLMKIAITCEIYIANEVLQLFYVKTTDMSLRAD